MLKTAIYIAVGAVVAIVVWRIYRSGLLASTFAPMESGNAARRGKNETRFSAFGGVADFLSEAYARFSDDSGRSEGSPNTAAIREGKAEAASGNSSDLKLKLGAMYE